MMPLWINWYLFPALGGMCAAILVTTGYFWYKTPVATLKGQR